MAADTLHALHKLLNWAVRFRMMRSTAIRVRCYLGMQAKKINHSQVIRC